MSILDSIGTIATIVSIVLTILNGHFLYKTDCIKKDIFLKIKGLELLPYASRFHSVFSDISKKALLESWNKAGKDGELISDLTSILIDYSQIQSAVSDVNRATIKGEIDTAHNLMDGFSEGHTLAKNRVLSALRKIDDLLQKEVDLFKSH
jgi:hypothetical protein